MSERGCGSLVLCFAWFALSLCFYCNTSGTNEQRGTTLTTRTHYLITVSPWFVLFLWFVCYAAK